MHKLVRTSVAAAGLVAALVLTGCGGSDSGGDDASKDKGTSSASPAESETGGSEPSTGTGADSLEGTWAGVTEGKAVALSVKEGQAALVADEHICQGTVQDMGGEPMLSLKCADGNTDRTMGSIDSNDGKTLVLSWEGGAKDSLTKTEAGGLPTDLPTELPTDLPTEIPVP